MKQLDHRNQKKNIIKSMQKQKPDNNKKQKNQKNQKINKSIKVQKNDIKIKVEKNNIKQNPKERDQSLKKLARINSLVHNQSPKLNQAKSQKKIRPKSSQLKNNNKKVVDNQQKKSKIMPVVKKQKNQNQKPNKQEQKALVNSQTFQQKDMGIIFLKPQFDRILFQTLEVTDTIYDKYFDMISNDNDTSYVLNAIPELKDYKKEEQKKLFDSVLTGRLSKISGLFDQLTVQKILSALKNKPVYFENKVKISNLKLILETKFKVSVDVGFLQYTLQNDKLIILRIYISKIYRKMNYIAYIYLQLMKQLSEKYPNQQKICVFLYEKNISIIKFYKYMGFKIERIVTDSKSQKVDYFQEFVIKKKEFMSAYQKINSGLI